MVDKPKKAVQYSTGINNAIKRVAKKHDKTVNEYINELLQESKTTKLPKGKSCLWFEIVNKNVG